jgi:hypothetical protein
MNNLKDAWQRFGRARMSVSAQSTQAISTLDRYLKLCTLLLHFPSSPASQSFINSFIFKSPRNILRMHLSALVSVGVALAAATPALAQCRGPMGTRDTFCNGRGGCDIADVERHGSLCPPGQKTQWGVKENKCRDIDVCVWEVSVPEVR